MKKLIYSAFVLGILMSCNSGPHKDLDTTSSGTINIAVDETFQPIIESEIEVFQADYREAKLNAHYLPEGDCFKELLQDSARIVVSTRDLTSEEKKVFDKLHITPHITKIAIDALALVVNPANKDTAFTLATLKRIFSGETSNWKQLNQKSSLGNITVVFDNQGSSTSRYIKERLSNGKLPSNCFATKGNRELIEYVSKNPSAIGILGVNWISDRADSTSLSFLSKVKVAAISEFEHARSQSEFFQPYQAYIANGAYPLRRTVYIVSREARSGLGTGFISFVAADKGQRIILKSSLVPATVPVRIVNIH